MTVYDPILLASVRIECFVTETNSGGPAAIHRAGGPVILGECIERVPADGHWGRAERRPR